MISIRAVLFVCLLFAATSLVASQTCNQLTASDPAVCSGHGRCVSDNVCNCYPGWTGSQCDSFNCAGNNNCNGKGTCVGPNVCQCSVGNFGLGCETSVQCPASSLLFYAPLDDTGNATLRALGLTPDIVSGRFLVMDNTTLVQASCSQAANFSSQNADITYDKDLTLSTTFQVEFKFRLRAGSSGEQVIMWMFDRDPSIVLRSLESNLTVEIRNVNETRNMTFSNSFRDNQWHHISITRSGALFQATVDGMPKLSLTVTSLASGNFGNRNQYSLIFGHDPWFRHPFTGLLDEFKIWECTQGVLADCRTCACLNGAQCVGKNICRCLTAGLAGNLCDIGCYGIPRTAANVCSGNGTCTGIDTCVCREGYSGNQCNFITCNGLNQTNPSVCNSRGSCTGPNVCSCTSQFTGSNCQFIKCFGKSSQDPTVCNSNGACSSSDKCTCNAGYSGNECQTKDTAAVFCFGKAASDPTVCSGRGQCPSADRCVCTAGFVGPACEFPICNGIPANDTLVCSNAGTCADFNRCNCNAGYSGTNCEFVSCFGKTFPSDPTACSGRGRCVGLNNCFCEAGYTGDCSLRVCFGKNSSDPTVCNGGTCTSPNSCSCPSGRSGLSCELSVCFGKLSTDRSVCNAHGTCNGGTCTCESGWAGTDCSIPVCNGKLATDSTVCSGKGTCVSSNTCNCFQDSTRGFFSGSDCSVCRPDYTPTGTCLTPKCDATTCNNRGTCTGGICTCTGNFAGQFCENCIANFFGSSCNIQCTRNGNCNNHGTCDSTGACVCDNSASLGRWTGTSCTSCASQYYGTGCNIGIGSTFTFSDNFNSISGLLVIPSQTSNTITCSAVFATASLTLLGTSPVCSWPSTDSTLFRVVLSNDATLKAGDTLSVITGQNPVSVTVAGPANPVAPIAAISAFDTVSSCESITLNSFGSFSADRRALTYKWGITNGYQIAPIQSFLNGQTGSSVTISSSLLTLDTTYTFTLQVTNAFGVASLVTSKAVTFLAKTTVALTVVGPTFVQPGDPFSLSGIVTGSTCDSTLARSVTTNWKQISGPTVAPVINGRNLVFDARTLPVMDATLVFEFSAAPLSRPDAVARRLHTVTIRAGSLVASILGGNRVLANTATLLLDGHRSFDESGSRRFNATPTVLQFRWSCFNISSGDSCGSPFASLASNERISIALGGSPLVLGQFRFTLTILSGLRSASTSQVITIVSASTPALQFKFSVLSRIARGVPIRLVSFIDDITLYNFVWRVFYASGVISGNTLPLTSSIVETATNAPAIRFRGTAFEEGQQYTIRCEATHKTTGQVGISEAGISINAAPVPGTFSVSPNLGVAGTTRFTFIADRWADEDLPLSYTFGYLDDSRQQARVVLRDSIQSNTFTTLLPRGTATGSTLTVFVIVRDLLGASTYASQTVTVNAVATSDPVAWARTLFEDQGANSQDAETAALLAATAANELVNFNPTGKRATVAEVQTVISNLAGLLSSSKLGRVTEATMISQGAAIAALTANSAYVTPQTQDRLIAYAASVVSAIKNHYSAAIIEHGQVSLSTEATSIMCNALSNLARFVTTKSKNVADQLTAAVRDLLLTVNFASTPGDVARSFGCANLHFFAQSDYAASFNGKTFTLPSAAASSPSPVPAAISLPSDFTLQVPAFDFGVTNAIQQTNNPYGSHESSKNISSTVVSMTVYDGDSNTELRVFNFTSKINITVPGAYNVTEYNFNCGRAGKTPVCRYWTDSNGWVADKTCSLVNITDSYAICSCNHLTDFAVSVDLLSPANFPITPVDPKIIINMDPYNPTTTVFAGFSVIAYIIVFIILSIVERNRGARLTDQTDKNKKLIEIGYFRRIVHNIQKFHTWVGIFFRPETEQNHYSLPQRLTVIFTILFVMMAVTSLLYGTYPWARTPNAFFIVCAIVANVAAIPFSGLVTYLFRNTKVQTNQVMRVANVTTFENKEFEAEDLSHAPPVNTAPSDAPNKTSSNVPDNLVTGSANLVDEDDVDKPSTTITTTTTTAAAVKANEPLPSNFASASNLNVSDSHALGNTDFEMEELGNGPAPLEPAPLDTGAAQDRPAADNDDDDDDDDADVLPVPPSLARQQQQAAAANASTTTTGATSTTSTTNAVKTGTPATVDVKKQQDKIERSQTRAAIKREFKGIEKTIGGEPARFKVRTAVGDFLDKGDDTFDALKMSEGTQSVLSVILTLGFILSFLVVQAALVVLFHFTLYWWWQPYFTTLYMLLSAVITLAVFEYVYFTKKHEKWRTEKRWTTGRMEVILPGIGIFLTVIAFIVTLAVALGTQFWSSGFGIGHVVSVLVFELLVLALLGLFIVLVIARPNPASIAEASRKDQPFIAWWSVFVIYPLVWALYLGCIAICITFGFYLSAQAGGMWILAYVFAILLDLVVTKFGTVIVMGFFMPVYSFAVETVFFPKLAAVTPTARPAATTSAPTAAPAVSTDNVVASTTNTSTQPSLVPDPISVDSNL